MSDEAALWAAVVIHAFRDAESGCPKARRWLTTRSRDFRMVCALAGSDADVIGRHARRLLAANGSSGPIGASSRQPPGASPAAARPEIAAAALLRRLASLREAVT